MNRSILVAMRDSLLSQAQVKEVLHELHQFHPHIEFIKMQVKTTGDKDLKTSLRSLGKTDFFTKEVDDMVLTGKCCIAIHSAKDLPDPLPTGLTLVALTRGVDSADALVLKEKYTLQTLPFNAKIGTSSIRREIAVQRLREDLQCVDIRGTIERRLQLLDENQLDGLIVAEAALIRLGLTHRHRIRLDFPTNPLQGRLAIVAKEQDQEMQILFSCLMR